LAVSVQGVAGVHYALRVPVHRAVKMTPVECWLCLWKAWPEDALEMVANKFLEDVDLEDNVRSETIAMCKHFHESIRHMSQRYFDTLRRHNYVTPTSYLELILTFKNLLSRKREEILMLKNRYLTGLEKLQFAASQVCVSSFGVTTGPPTHSVGGPD